jgi:hypothetical protein
MKALVAPSDASVGWDSFMCSFMNPIVMFFLQWGQRSQQGMQCFAICSPLAPWHIQWHSYDVEAQQRIGILLSVLRILISYEYFKNRSNVVNPAYAIEK